MLIGFAALFGLLGQMALVASAGDTFPDYRWLGTHLEIKAAKRPVRWAVAFGGDAAFPPGEFPVSGTVASFSQPLGGSFTIDLGTQVRRPLLQDAKEHVTLSTPTLGRVESLTNDQGGAILSSFQREGVAPRLANIRQRSIWHAPASVRAEFMAFTLTGVRHWRCSSDRSAIPSCRYGAKPIRQARPLADDVAQLRWTRTRSPES